MSNGTSIRNINRNIAEMRGYQRHNLSEGKMPVISSLDEYVKHRPHFLALGRWIRMGKPDEPFTRPLNSKQRREATRESRLKAHNRRNAMANRNTTGKSARRRYGRRPAQ